MLATILTVAVVAAPAAPQLRSPEGLTEQRRQEAAKHFRKGDDAFHSEQFEEAEREFRKAIGLDPLMTLAHYRLGQTFMAERQFPDAVQAFVGCRNAFQEISRIGLRDAGELDRRRTEEINALRAVRLVGHGLVVQQAAGHDRDLVPAPGQVPGLAVHVLGDAAELREVVVRHDRDAHAPRRRAYWRPGRLALSR